MKTPTQNSKVKSSFSPKVPFLSQIKIHSTPRISSASDIWLANQAKSHRLQKIVTPKVWNVFLQETKQKGKNADQLKHELTPGFWWGRMISTSFLPVWGRLCSVSVFLTEWDPWSLCKLELFCIHTPYQKHPGYHSLPQVSHLQLAASCGLNSGISNECLRFSAIVLAPCYE